MTETQQTTLLTLFKQGKTYREISEIIGLSPHTIASFLRRKHKHLQTLRQLSQRQNSIKHTKLIQAKFGIPDYQAQAIYESIRSRFDVKRQNSKAKGVEFSVQLSDLDIPLSCPILGITLDYFAENSKADNYPTFDRIDNTRGYVSGNVHIVSWRANRIKNDGTAEEHRKIAEYLDSLITRRERS